MSMVISLEEVELIAAARIAQAIKRALSALTSHMRDYDRLVIMGVAICLWWDLDLDNEGPGQFLLACGFTQDEVEKIKVKRPKEEPCQSQS